MIELAGTLPLPPPCVQARARRRSLDPPGSLTNAPHCRRTGATRSLPAASARPRRAAPRRAAATAESLGGGRKLAHLGVAHPRAHERRRMERYVKGRECGRGAEGTIKMATLTDLGKQHYRQRFGGSSKRQAPCRCPPPQLQPASDGLMLCYSCREDLTVAIKKIRAVDFRNLGAGMKVEALREVKILTHLSHGEAQHKHIVSLLDVFVHKRDSLKLVFDYIEIDLQRIMDSRHIALTPAVIKGFGTQLLRGLAHLHDHRVLHRDIKPNNLLIGADGVLQVSKHDEFCI